MNMHGDLSDLNLRYLFVCFADLYNYIRDLMDWFSNSVACMNHAARLPYRIRARDFMNVLNHIFRSRIVISSFMNECNFVLNSVLN